jgi:hypothetical protein
MEEWEKEQEKKKSVSSLIPIKTMKNNNEKILPSKLHTRTCVYIQ